MNIAAHATSKADIVGDGPAALVAAMALAQRGWGVRLINPSRRQSRQSRIDVLGASALSVLLRLGLSPHEIHTVARPCPGSWCRWDTDDAHCHDYLTGPFGSAWAVDRASFEVLLRDHVAKAGVTFASDNEQPVLSENTGTLASAAQHEVSWRILASGCVNSRSGLRSATGYNDRLIALVTFGRIDGVDDSLDTRLLIEAAADGWAYGIVGPDNLACLGVITDAESLAGETPRAIVSRVLDATDRVASLVTKLSQPIAFQAIPIPCRWLPLKVDPTSLRLGDAQASFDPLAGRGLWSAIRMAEEISIALDTRPDKLALLEQKSRASYQRYLAQRLSSYRAGRDRFKTGFWTRRCSSENALAHAGSFS
ncbi:2-polyprenyl-6-methoxyphenol hydroxylase-like FAD-dependent oxidoreductase [Sinorhizobium meliloti]|uniref:FAD-dependent monooxygenase n=1 Tax=Rhizobium meliloti TaxID=382 RepID=UPI00030272A3|nr:FAD-dependent monooxygenase [Sinorhizobium meliloti]MBP2470649.1 2-polyprenyl-6-methoxyphenol hydroxylase-like FAD-dependent oxidoreductase [Sinorhizobium meliloti]MDE3786133.1 FAD-dependent monooxygenase [Sinorhizobium meliloti]MDE4550487.1 FAD-dependent monooxygenase [Sinorhizobium meliloti]MDE4598093.1 FAD-dependent monooxygenase [Sinorhizobium meliloti]MQW78856.1 hypothetical protein [Sinorhizobium meliloti]